MAQMSAELIAQWHPTKNLPFLPTQFSSGSSSKKWVWVCDLGHEWPARILTRTNGHGCPYCSGLAILAGYNDLATRNPILASEWHPTLNLPLSPNDIGIGNRKRVFWLCNLGHTWESSTADRVSKNIRCHYCSNRNLLKGYNDLFFRNPKLAKEWHPTRNGELRADEIKFCSSEKVWWLGKNCGHEWLASVSSRFKGRGCRFCSGNEVIVGFNDLPTANPELAAQWHPTKNGDFKATDVTFSSGLKAWWLHPLCGHFWEAQISNRRNGAGCAVCAGKVVLKGFNDLASVNPALAAEWHPTKNGSVKPDEVMAWSGKRYWWLCSNGHEWDGALGSRNHKKGGPIGHTVCIDCDKKRYVSKPEIELFDFLTSLGLFVEQSNRRILGGNQEVDLYLPSLKLAVEFNGLYWHSDRASKRKKVKEKVVVSQRHIVKWRAAQEAGIELLQIWEDDWFSRKPQVLKMLALKCNKVEEFAQLHPEFAVIQKPTSAKISQESTQLLSEEEARVFFEANYVAGHVKASHYLGLFDSTQTLVAALALEGYIEDARVEILGYVQSSASDSFSGLLKEARNLFPDFSFSAVASNDLNEGSLLEAHGFAAEQVLEPDFMFVISNVRISKYGYSLGNFITNPDLKYATGLSLEELISLNKLARIWDAGKTVYKLEN